MSEPNIYNIPAYQRKRSIISKLKNTSNPKASKSRKTSSRKRKVIREIEEMPIITIDQFPDPIAQPPKIRQSSIREMKICGLCEGYFDKIEVAIVKLTSPIRVDDLIIFEKTDGLFEQAIKSMQIDRKEVTLARSGSDIGLKVAMPPKVGGLVYKVIET